jgi:hypothetical protein
MVTADFRISEKAKSSCSMGYFMNYILQSFRVTCTGDRAVG